MLDALDEDPDTASMHEAFELVATGEAHISGQVKERGEGVESISRRPPFVDT